MKLRMRPGAFVVFEGIDKTGKSTQLNNLRFAQENFELFVDTPVLFTHQPSGGTDLGKMIYSYTEHGRISSPLARQLLHLASHAEHYDIEIVPHLESGGAVFMDRCWWSTVAYGWFAGFLHDSIHLNLEEFIKVARAPTQGYMPDEVFLFLSAYEEDPHNTTELRRGYEFLADYCGAVLIPYAPAEIVTEYIFGALSDRGLAEAVG